MSDGKIVDQGPHGDLRAKAEAEANAANAQKIIAERMEALKRGETIDVPAPETIDEVGGQNTSNYPTLIVELPSKGKLYPPENPLSKGTVEMKYMTAKEEDILTTESYITSGVVLDKLFQSLIISKINYSTMLLGDRDAIMMAARIYGYGEIYDTEVVAPSGRKMKVPIDLTELPHKELSDELEGGENLFSFKTSRGDTIEFKLLTVEDQRQIDKKLKGGKKAGARDTQLTTRLGQMIKSVNGNDDRRFIKMFIENQFLAIDSRKFREYVNSVQPGVDMSLEIIDEGTGEPFRTNLAIGLDFFWTNA